jgi:hypothetical protein
VPVQVTLPAAVRQVFQGGSGAKNGQTVAILANGSVWAWGDNDRGQLGNGTRVSSDIPLPVDVPKGVSFVKVSSGGYAGYAIDGSGRLWAWGDNASGQLGTGSGSGIATRPVSAGIRLTHVRDSAPLVSTIGAWSQGCMVIPAGPGGGVEYRSGEAPVLGVLPRRPDCHFRPGHGCPG